MSFIRPIREKSRLFHMRKRAYSFIQESHFDEPVTFSHPGKNELVYCAVRIFEDELNILANQAIFIIGRMNVFASTCLLTHSAQVFVSTVREKKKSNFEIENSNQEPKNKKRNYILIVSYRWKIFYSEKKDEMNAFKLVYYYTIFFLRHKKQLSIGIVNVRSA